MKGTSPFENKATCVVSGAWNQKALFDPLESEDEMFKWAVAMSLEVQVESDVQKKEEESDCWKKCNVL